MSASVMEVGRTERRPVRWSSAIILIVAAFLLLFLGSAAYFAYRPLAFQWATTIVVGSVADLPPGAAPSLDVAAVISRIPYKDGGVIYTANPEERYRRTILGGEGNCANMALGLGWQLIRDRVPFQIVEMLPVDGFLDGEGHTVVNVHYQLDGVVTSGIVDIVEGGLPARGGVGLTLQDLLDGRLSRVSIRSFNRRRDVTSEYYETFLDHASIGVIQGEDLARYYDIHQRTYLSLGGGIFEKYFYRTLGILTGSFPLVYVDQKTYDRLWKGHESVRAVAIYLLWVTRAAIVGIVVLAAIGFVRGAGRLVSGAPRRR